MSETLDNGMRNPVASLRLMLEDAMMEAMTLATCEECLADVTAHEEEVQWTLDAIVGAIAAGKLPPDDAFAWARIAVREVETLTHPRAGVR